MTNSLDNATQLAFTVPQVCDAIGLKKTRVYELMTQGAIPAKRCGGKPLVLREDLICYLRGLPAYAKDVASK